MTALRSLTHAQRLAKFGAFKFEPRPVPGNPERIEITDDWARTSIKIFDCPQLVPLRGKDDISLHRMAGDAFVALWQAWDDAGLLPLVLSFNGAWVPRYKRGRGPKVVNGVAQKPYPGAAQLSNHSWGTAFDINARWNPLGRVPALPGTTGCVRDLVPLANEHRFFWGGHFGSRPDGMHFEYVG